ncbi:MAG: DUF4132 domain-containing protein [Candidatus Obscuribacter sp.]|nr:DUF4132 domain-containing protein [Candidatus Obscuribacter sp.]
MKEVALKYVEGTSNKFWKIKQSANKLVIHFGRVGTAGQEKLTEFSSKEEALASLDKQVKEKLKKGYTKVHETSAEEVADDKSAIVQAAPASGERTPYSRVSSKTSQINSRPTPTQIEITRTLALKPEDIGFAFNLRKAPLPLPPKRPFNRIDTIQSILKVSSHDSAIIERWKELDCSALARSTEENYLWLIGITEVYKYRYEILASGIFNYPKAKSLNEQRIYKAIANRDLSIKPTTAEIVQIVRSVGLNHHATNFNGSVLTKVTRRDTMFSLAFPILGLVSMEDFLTIWETIWDTYADPCVTDFEGAYAQSAIISAVRSEVLPYISEMDVENLKEYVSKQIAANKWQPKDSSEQVPVPYIMAALLCMREHLLPAIEAIPDGFYKKETKYPDLARPQMLVLGLAEPGLILKHWHRLGLRISKRGESWSWAAQLGWQNLEPICDFLEEAMSEYFIKPPIEHVLDLLQPLFMVKAPETARYIFRLSLSKHFTKVCRKWLQENPEYSFIGLLSYKTENTDTARQALRYLTDLTQRLKKECLPREYWADFDQISNSKIQGKAAQQPCPEWLAELFKRHDRPKRITLPKYLQDVALSPLYIEGYCLNDDQIEHLLLSMKSSTPDKVAPILKELREKVPRSTFDNFVGELFERWMNELAPSKDKWCMLAIGYLGSDEAVCKLIPHMKAWRAGGNPGRAAFGLDCMRACGSDVALMKLHEISQTASLKSLKHRAVADLSEIARQRGFTKEQLEDRIVPTCGLDEKGKLTFSYGKREFYFLLSPDLKAHLKDQEGKVRDELPSPNQQDDPVLAAESIKLWKSIKNQVKTVAKVQSAKLETALISSRTWKASEFDSLVRRHPLIKHIARQLIWGEVDAQDRLISTFRCTDEDELADENDREMQLKADSRIIILHPLRLSQELIEKWGQIVSDYNLVPPFAQMSRPVFRLTEEEKRTNHLSRFDSQKIEAVALVGALDRRGWSREAVGDGPLFCGHYKYFPGKDVTAHVSYPGVIPGMLKDSEKQEISQVAFLAGRTEPNSWMRYATQGSELNYSKVNPIIMSEVIADLVLATAKAEKL